MICQFDRHTGLPTSLEDAVNAFESDPLSHEVLGEAMCSASSNESLIFKACMAEIYLHI